MKVTLFQKDPNTYTCNVYLIRGDWNAISDVNTLIDVGTNGFILNELQTISTGVGKKRVEQVILTHEHFDHTGGLNYIIENYKPKVYAFSKISGVTEVLHDGMQIKVGDTYAEILHTPGHSHDSACIYFPHEKILFSGDTAINIKSPGGSYTIEYVKVIENLLEKDIQIVYSGHDDPLTENVKYILENTYKNIISSKIIK
jgi:glyoxylase-like metal-dependent hydrolase (beta-lactamase superfamily II)